jgi:hypothetical protein
MKTEYTKPTLKVEKYLTEDIMLNGSQPTPTTTATEADNRHVGIDDLGDFSFND